MLKTKKATKTFGSLIGRIVLLQDYHIKKFRLVKITGNTISEVLVESDKLSPIRVYCAANGIECPKPIIDFSRMAVLYPEPTDSHQYTSLSC